MPSSDDHWNFKWRNCWVNSHTCESFHIPTFRDKTKCLHIEFRERMNFVVPCDSSFTVLARRADRQSNLKESRRPITRRADTRKQNTIRSLSWDELYFHGKDGDTERFDWKKMKRTRQINKVASVGPLIGKRWPIPLWTPPQLEIQKDGCWYWYKSSAPKWCQRSMTMVIRDGSGQTVKISSPVNSS